MPKWEYKILDFNSGYCKPIAEVLADYGDGGWELCSVVAGSGRDSKIYLKRPIPDPAPHFQSGYIDTSPPGYVQPVGELTVYPDNGEITYIKATAAPVHYVPYIAQNGQQILVSGEYGPPSMWARADSTSPEAFTRRCTEVDHENGTATFDTPYETASYVHSNDFKFSPDAPEPFKVNLTPKPAIPAAGE